MDLAEDLSHIHNTFHVSQLRKYLVDDSMVLSLDDIQVDERLNYVERMVPILDNRSKALYNKVMPLVKVKCQH